MKALFLGIALLAIGGYASRTSPEWPLAVDKRKVSGVK
jgi:hypothetical protein